MVLYIIILCIVVVGHCFNCHFLGIYYVYNYYNCFTILFVICYGEYFDDLTEDCEEQGCAVTHLHVPIYCILLCIIDRYFARS